MNRPGRAPWKFLAGVSFDKRFEPTVIFEHGRPHVDKPFHPFGSGEQPAFAIGAEMVTGWTVNSANDGFTLGDQNLSAGNAALNENALALMR
jgi:hypothetical protein